MIRRKNSVTQQTLRVVNLSRRNVKGQSPNQTVMMDAGASRRNRGRTGPGVDLVNPNPKNLVAVRSPDTGLAPAQGGKTSSYLILSLFVHSRSNRYIVLNMLLSIRCTLFLQEYLLI